MEEHLFWITSRAAGIAALLLSSAAVGVGLTMGGRMIKAAGSTCARRMTSPTLIARRLRVQRIRRTVSAAAVCVFIALFSTIYVQMAAGNDPALSASTATSTSTTTTTSEETTSDKPVTTAQS